MYGCSEPLSRACLGKSDDVSVPDATLDHQNKTDMRRRLFVHHGKVLTLRKTALFLEFSLCLSRACLGKMLFKNVFMHEWLKKRRFYSPAHPRPHRLRPPHPERRNCREKQRRVYVCVCVREFVELAGQNPPMICQDKLRATATAGKTPRQQRSSDW